MARGLGRVISRMRRLVFRRWVYSRNRQCELEKWLANFIGKRA